MPVPASGANGAAPGAGMGQTTVRGVAGDYSTISAFARIAAGIGMPSAFAVVAFT
jgi:hypothetical protein